MSSEEVVGVYKALISANSALDTVWFSMQRLDLESALAAREAVEKALSEMNKEFRQYLSGENI